MPVAQQHDVKEIFHESLRRDPGESRSTYLEAACGDDEDLRNEVESLLTSLDEARSFLETPIIPESAIEVGTASLSPGRMISHYRIESLLGCGGMGEVYLASDTILKRPVALKMVPDSLSTDSARVRRFEREAQAIAELNHPNILTIYEFATFRDKHFIVSEFITGETVRRRLANGPMPIFEVLDVTIQTAEALQAAHSAGIIHRDIKPENIMIRDDGYVKILDFGLAKLTAEPDTDTQADKPITSEPGLILGTSSYISPEQARGRDVDHRTDLFSLGVVIYEMLTGVQPFRGETAVDVVAEIIQTDPSPAKKVDERVPRRLSRLVTRLLEKDPKDRYANAAQLKEELMAIRARITGRHTPHEHPEEPDLDILELPTFEFPQESDFPTRYSLYFKLLLALLFILMAFLAYRRLG